jgi:hypothetical protein
MVESKETEIICAESVSYLYATNQKAEQSRLIDVKKCY